MRKEAKHTEGPCAVLCPDCNSPSRFTFVADSHDIFRIWCTKCPWHNDAELSRERSRLERARTRANKRLDKIDTEEKALTQEHHEDET